MGDNHTGIHKCSEGDTGKLEFLNMNMGIRYVLNYLYRDTGISPKDVQNEVLQKLKNGSNAPLKRPPMLAQN